MRQNETHDLTGRLIQVLRELKERGVSQVEIAQRLGLSKTAISNWKMGAVQNLKHENLYGFEDIYGYSARWIATGKGPKMVAQVQEQAAQYVISKKVASGELLDISRLSSKAKSALEATVRAFDDDPDCPQESSLESSRV